MVTKPYIDETICEHSWIRTFDPFVTDSIEYVWHRDSKSRNVTVLEGEGWLFQTDNEMPKNINKGNEFYIEKMVYHRLLVGSTPLVIKIEEVDE